MAPISEQKRNLRFLFLVIILITIPCYCLGFVVLSLANRVSGIEPLPTEVVLPTSEQPTETVTLTNTPENMQTATLETQTATLTGTATITKTRFLTPTATITLTSTPTATATHTVTPTDTATPMPTATATETPTFTNVPPTATEES